MQYISGINSRVSEVERVKNLLIKSTPVLESFGNAKTIRNDNSSRFVSRSLKHNETMPIGN